MKKIRYDESLLAFFKIVSSAIGEKSASESIFLRDGTGRLSVILSKNLSKIKASNLEELIRLSLGGYCRSDSLVRTPKDPGAEIIINQFSNFRPVIIEDKKINYIERRIVGSDWLKSPPPQPKGIPRIIFASLKGGVGRSTALSVAAAYLSIQGKRTLAIDLDLEAPGIGTMLLRPEALPEFGSLDFLVENGISGIDNQFVVSSIGSSYLGKNGAKVDIVPAIGSSTINNPENAIAKISRAYLEDISDDGNTITLSDQIGSMVERYASTGDYDIILIDSRAGLHEINASVIMGVGGEILLFGVDQPQTFQGYKLLISHLNAHDQIKSTNWRENIHFVSAKASRDEKKQAESNERFLSLSNLLYQVALGDVSEETFDENDFDIFWDDDAQVEDIDDESSSIIQIFDDSNYKIFDPIADEQQLKPDLFLPSYEQFLNWIDNIIESKLEE